MEQQPYICPFPLRCRGNTSSCHIPQTASFRILRLRGGEKRIEPITRGAGIIFLLEGVLLVENTKLLGGQALVLPSLSSACLECFSHVQAIMTYLYPGSVLYEGCLAEIPSKPLDSSQNAYPLEMHRVIMEYLYLLRDLLAEGLDCPEFFRGKALELLILFNAYYSLRQRKSFFAPLLRPGMEFEQRVMACYKKVRTVKELAVKMNYSLSAFRVHFEKHFNMPVYRWMQLRKAEKIREELSSRGQELKDISLSNGFSSIASFYVFCRRCFGDTPLNIRDKLANGKKVEILI